MDNANRSDFTGVDGLTLLALGAERVRSGFNGPQLDLSSEESQTLTQPECTSIGRQILQKSGGIEQVGSPYKRSHFQIDLSSESGTLSQQRKKSRLISKENDVNDDRNYVSGEGILELVPPLQITREVDREVEEIQINDMSDGTSEIPHFDDYSVIGAAPWNTDGKPVEQEKYSNNYALLFNREVVSFFKAADSDEQLEPTVVNTRGVYKIKLEKGGRGYKTAKAEKVFNDGDAGDELSDTLSDSEVHQTDNNDSFGPTIVNGSLWSPEEKEKFFLYLSRFSRHNLDNVSKAIGTKSLVECEIYNQLLYDAYSTLETKMPLEDIPFAVEMSEPWVEMENIQSRSISLSEDQLIFENKQLTKEGLKFSKDTLISKKALLHFSEIWQNLVKSNEEELIHEPGDEYLRSFDIQFSDDFLSYIEFHIRDIARRIIVEASVLALQRKKLSSALKKDTCSIAFLRARDIDLAALKLGVHSSPDSILKKSVIKLNYEYSDDIKKMEPTPKYKLHEDWPSSLKTEKCAKSQFPSDIANINIVEDNNDSIPCHSLVQEYAEAESIMNNDDENGDYRDTHHNEDLELQLWRYETNIVDALDMAISTAHEDSLTKWIETYNDPPINSSQVANWIDKKLKWHMSKRRQETASRESLQERLLANSHEQNSTSREFGSSSDYSSGEESSSSKMVLDDDMIQRYMTTFSGSGYVAGI